MQRHQSAVVIEIDAVKAQDEAVDLVVDGMTRHVEWERVGQSIHRGKRSFPL